MSIIIRLQNLPWAANSVDIRRYFAGLSIPEGGVHIVGGEKGDAFIAFGTDEDARQAMERDGGKIKDMKVKLLLSSRTEMTRVIEQARNQTLSLQTPAAVKAAVNDSDRRKVRERSPSPRRREREKSPSRDRERRRSAKRDRSRSRSRSPSRRNKDRERDNDRRGDRSRKEDRYSEDSHDRYRNREFSPRDSVPERRQYPQTDKDVLPPQQNLEPSKGFDPRMGSTPQTYDPRQAAGAIMHYNVRPDTMPPHSVSYLEPQNVSGGHSYLFPAAMNTVPITKPTNVSSEQMQPPFNASNTFQPNYDNRIPSNTVGNYESKRPSPTPATSAPNVDSSAPYAKPYGTSDPYSSSMPYSYGDYPAATYGTVQTAERGAVPAVPNERRVFHSNQPIYGAEPHARYDQIPEANQAGRSTNASAPREMAGHESGFYGKMLPSNMPTVTSSNNFGGNKPPRRSRFEPEYPMPEDNQFHAASAPKADLRAHDSFARQMDAHGTFPKNVDSGFPHQRERPVTGTEAPWSTHPSGSNSASWMGDGQSHYAEQHPSLLDEHHETVPMDIDEDSMVQTAPPMRNAAPPSYPDNRNVRPGHMSDNRMHTREPFNYLHHKQHPMDTNFESKPPSNIREPLMSEARHGSPLLNRNEPPNMPSLAVEVSGLPFDASDCDVVDLFRGIFIPHENIKLQRNHYGKPNGYAYVKFLNVRDFEEGLSRNRTKIGNFYVDVSPCPLSIFENAPCEMNIPQGRALEASSPPRNVLENRHFQRQMFDSGMSGRKTDPNCSPRKNSESLPSKREAVVPRKPLEAPQKLPDPMSQQKSVEHIPLQKQLGSSPTRKPSEHVHPRKPEENVPPRKPEEHIPSRKPAEHVQPRKPVEHVPSRKPVEHVPSRKPVEHVPSRKPEEHVPPRKPTEHVPSRNTSEYVPPRNTSEHVPPRNTSEHVPPRNATEHAPARNTTEHVPPRKQAEHVPSRKPAENIPSRKPAEHVPLRQAAEHIPPRKTEQAPSRKLVETSPQRDPVESTHSRNSGPAPSRKTEPVSQRKVMDPPSRKPIEPSPARKPLESKPPPRKSREQIPPRRSSEHPRKHFEPSTPAFRSNLDPCEEDLVVELKGLPYSCQDEEVIHFFDGLSILDIFIELGPDGRATGVGFVEFATPADFHAALDLNGKRIGHRYIDVFVASKEIMAVARGQRPKPPLLPHGPPRDLPQPSLHALRSQPPPDTFCVTLNDLPKHVKNHDIADFFADVNLIPRAIHIMLNPNKTPTGEAFAEFNTRREAEMALKRNGINFAGSRVSVSPISYQEMVNILGSPPSIAPLPQQQSTPLLMNPPENEHLQPRRTLMPLPVDNDIPMEEHRPHDLPPGRGQPDYSHDDMAPFDHPESGGRPSFGRMRGIVPRSDASRPPRSSFRPNGPSSRGSPFHPQHTGPPRYSAPPHEDLGPKDFGLPGCVVAIDNLHFRANLDDLLEFFCNFDLDKNSIIRKYNENGQATGEARVAFNCHEDAKRAVQTLNMKPVMGRPISLSLI